MFKKCIWILLFVGCDSPSSTNPGIEKYPVSASTLSKEIVRSQSNSKKAIAQPYVLLISLDGFRYDYAEKYHADILNGFQVSAKYMIPSFPTNTFPNHYTIVTGLYPGNHGLVSNSFYDTEKRQMYRMSDRSMVEDPDWYFGTPLWVLASQQEMVSASMFWVGSETPVQGVYPTYYFKYDGSISHLDRINKVIQWLTLPEDKRPHLITLYFSVIDSKGHKFGPESIEIDQAVKELNIELADLMDKINGLDLNLNVIVVSDHGMLEVANEEPVNVSDYINLDKEVVSLSMPTMIYSDNKVLIDQVFEEMSVDERVNVYYKENLPDYYHYSLNSRIGDLIIMPKPNYIISTSNQIPSLGTSTHGWEPNTPEMGAIFYANGPAFKSGIVLEPFENIHIYPMIARILNLNYHRDSIDGKIAVLEPILKKTN